MTYIISTNLTFIVANKHLLYYIPIHTSGKLEILASCTDGQDGKEGNFYLYTLPDNWRSPENWERKLLAGNFKPFQSTFNPKTMSPGKFKIFYPSL